MQRACCCTNNSISSLHAGFLMIASFSHTDTNQKIIKAVPVSSAMHAGIPMPSFFLPSSLIRRSLSTFRLLSSNATKQSLVTAPFLIPRGSLMKIPFLPSSALTGTTGRKGFVPSWSPFTRWMVSSTAASLSFPELSCR